MTFDFLTPGPVHAYVGSQSHLPFGVWTDGRTKSLRKLKNSTHMATYNGVDNNISSVEDLGVLSLSSLYFIMEFGCEFCTVYKRFVVLSACKVIIFVMFIL